MPLYNYHCPDCDKDSEMLVGVSETPACPSCGSLRLEQLVSRIAPEGKLKAAAKVWRAQAAREGHASNFSAAERKR
ncbi:zinc ribbon domain-containing protein [Xanthobacter dioxanivorans]|uniref:Zinc ribbon domain-containing protein n=1 Tax=Xanthobacter dioxanivorans TaxID=2528964 RepID=A0A974PUM8_9HYPH|nr:zinc ribbon domain-containing protein [Xanthobacter dioxanivorans]QRG09756.1 zinc ribbon domain-containing protein [Xanthobacter dioxanivorans]